uniref:Scaffolding anchor of CK1 domain-containing protein n=1 Tax=Pelusios castaneus TaxID=367368 RepID=A0A8C8VNF8_9SAUR
MANRSQCLEDAAGRWPAREPSSPQLYSEAQRLALEELVAGGRAAFRAFLRRERLPGFLSEPEIQAVLQAAAPPAGAEEGPAEPSPGASLDASSLTYFPERSDLEPPVLELGWPAFGSGSYRGLTRAEAFFQPGFGESVYGCKEAVRRQIRSAREVIALVMDTFTDIDLFRDLQEACRTQKVSVYILLDRASFPHFLKMCRNLGTVFIIHLMRVRTISGNIYCTRSGVKIVGKVQEKFMLVDGIRAIVLYYLVSCIEREHVLALSKGSTVALLKTNQYLLHELSWVTQKWGFTQQDRVSQAWEWGIGVAQKSRLQERNHQSLSTPNCCPVARRVECLISWSGEQRPPET